MDVKTQALEFAVDTLELDPEIGVPLRIAENRQAITTAILTVMAVILIAVALGSRGGNAAAGVMGVIFAAAAVISYRHPRRKFIFF